MADPRFRFHPNPDVRWAVELRGIRLINGGSGKSVFLGYPQAAVWDLLSREYSFEKMTVLLSCIAGMEPSAATSFVDGFLREWAATGWLRMEKERG